MNSGETFNGSAPNGQSWSDSGANLEAQTSDLMMCLQRLARLQQTPIDILDLREAVGRLEKGELTPRRLKKGISALTKRLGSPKAHWFEQPEPSNMPLLTWSSAEGFSVLRGQNAVGQWVLEAWVSEEQVWLERVVDDLEGAVYAKISLAKVFQASQSPVYELIRNEVFSHKKILTEIILAGFVINTVALATSFYTMLVYDRVVPTGALSTLWVLTIGVAISVIYELITKVVRHRLYNRLINVVDQRLARSTFMQFLSVRLDQLPASVGSFASQLRGYEIVRNFLSSATSHVFVDAPFALLYAAIIAAIAGPLALIPLGVFVLCLAIGLSYKKQVEALTNSVDRAVNLKTGLLVEAVEGAETIKSGQGGWRLLSRWMQTTDDARVHEMRHRDISEQSKLLLGSLQQVSYVGIIFFGAQLASAGELTLGALIACSILSGRILAPVVMVPGLLIQWGQSKAALRGLDALWALQNDHDGQQPIAPDRVQGNFTFENVTASYKDNLALQIPTLNVRGGEKIAILGPVGAGKTTLLRLLSGMYKPQEGRVLLDGIDLGQLSKPVLAENMGYVQQDGRLFSGTLRENLTLGLLDPGDSVLLDVAKRTGLLQMVITPHPKGLMQEINEGGTGLSGGQRQLVNLTRAFLRDPKIWLLDEPTASMDRALEQTIIQALKDRMGSEQTLFLVTHKPDLLALVDRIILIAGKKIVADGPKDAVLAQLSKQASASSSSQNIQSQAKPDVDSKPLGSRDE